MLENPPTAAVLALARKPAPLPAPYGGIVRVATVEQLVKAIAGAKIGSTILLADGTYRMPPDVTLTQHRVTLRGESGVRENVILDGGDDWMRVLSLKGACDATIADLTIANCRWYGLFIYGDSNVQRLSVYNCFFHNIWTRAIKGTHPSRPNDDGDALPFPPSHVERVRPSDGSIRHCLFLNDQAKPHDDLFGGDYVSGIDMMQLRHWTIADNVFIGIRGRNGGGRGAIFIWMNSEHVVAERNIVIHCDRGICFGNPSSSVPNMFHGAVRNNVIVAGANMAIEVCETIETDVSHNSVFATDFGFDRTVNFAKESRGGHCFNNLIHGSLMMPPTVAHGGNLSGDFTHYFKNPAVADLHITPVALEAMGKVVRLPGLGEDFDGRPRGNPTNIGAFAT